MKAMTCLAVCIASMWGGGVTATVLLNEPAIMIFVVLATIIGLFLIPVLNEMEKR